MEIFSDNYRFEAASILRDLSMYKVLTREQLIRLYPGKERKVEKLLPYMKKQYRIWEVDGFYCTSPDAAKEIDRGLFLSVWVLIDFIDQVSFHAASSEYPGKLVFSVEGEIYEVIYADEGREALVNYLKISQNQDQDRTNYLILVDKPEQIMELNFPNTCGFCTVSPTGEVEYYQKE